MRNPLLTTSARIRNFFMQAICLACLATIGCGGNGRTSVSGTIKKGDQLIVTGTVRFLVGTESIDARIQEDGTYKATGVPVGEAKVLVISPQPADVSGHEMAGAMLERISERQRKDIAEQQEKEKKLRELWVELPARYSDPKTTPLRFQVKRGEDNLFNIPLSDE